MLSSMLSVLALLSGSIQAAPNHHHHTGIPKHRYGCGEVNVIFTGLPGHHPLVTAQGFNGTEVEEGIEQDAKNALAAGYNLKVVLMGPEIPMEKLEKASEGTFWHGTGLGYGVRGSHLANLTIRAENIVNYFHDEAPQARMLFDMNFTTALWAMQRNLPLSSDCKNHPGKNLGFDVYCDICD